MPESLKRVWHTRGYYGTLSHNAKAVYQRYLGWFDGNPANLNPHPPVQAGVRYVAAIGGAERLLAVAAAAFEDGDYRWVAELVSHLVFAQPDNAAARELLADALEQLGYQAESGPWRDFYLTGTMEAREPRPAPAAPRQGAIAQLFALDSAALLDSLAVRLDGERASAMNLVIAFDDGGRFELIVANGVLRHAPADGEAEVELERGELVRLVVGQTRVAEAKARFAGSGRDKLATLLAQLDRFDFWFNIVTP